MSVPIIRIVIFITAWGWPTWAWSQTVATKLATAFKTFASDAQLQNSISALYVVDATTGKVVFDNNGKVGLAPASTQKVITSVSAYSLLGKKFTYQTRFAYSPKNASLLIIPSGDPTLGSWRWAATKESEIFKKISQAAQNAGISAINEVIIDTEGWEEEAVPDGWLWQDIGNYYGAGPTKLNWRENQFDVVLKSGSQLGSAVSIAQITPPIYGYTLQSKLTAAASGTGDQAYIYFPLNAPSGIIRGTIPVNHPEFKISGAMPAPAYQFARTILDTLAANKVKILKNAPVKTGGKIMLGDYTTFLTISSPPLDSIIYWLNRKSVNLYSEALVKALSIKNNHTSSTEKGLETIRDFWKQKNILASELNMVDGSGLSPLNRVTTHAQVSILQHAQKQTWFKEFYGSLPQFNNMKMKSGTIRGAKGFCGYHTGPDGHKYVFSFLVNNYDGSPATLVQKMYKVLNALK